MKIDEENVTIWSAAGENFELSISKTRGKYYDLEHRSENLARLDVSRTAPIKVTPPYEYSKSPKFPRLRRGTPPKGTPPNGASRRGTPSYSGRSGG